METIIIVVAVILIIAAFFVGRSQSKPIEDNNNKIRESNKELTEQKHKLEKEIIELVRRINDGYIDKVKYVKTK